jgi:hypothetical protein
MTLTCPKCQSADISYNRSTTIDDAYDAVGQRYKCRNCGYEGSIAIEPEEEPGPVERQDFPYLIILVLAFLSFAALAFGAGVEMAALFFVIPTAVLLFFHYFFSGGGSGTVEDDLKSLDEDGKPAGKKK